MTIYTSHYDPSHCFEETKNLNIVVRGNFLPRTCFGRGHIVFASLRSIYLSIFASLLESNDVFHTDQISLYNLCLAIMTPIVFYCHFPDKLLATRNSFFEKTLSHAVRQEPTQTQCIYNQPSNPSTDHLRQWIACDHCNKWFHQDCMGILDSKDAENDWSCL